MGTRAFFSVSTTGSRLGQDLVVRMNADGWPPNLDRVAKRFCVLAKELGLFDQILSHDQKALKKVCRALCDESTGWLFLDKHKNVSAISHSAVLDVKNEQLYHYTGDLNVLNHTKSANIRELAGF